MGINRIFWKNGFTVDNIPEWNCPTCKKGILKGNKDSFLTNEDSLSKSYHSDQDWEPFWISGNFSGNLKCNNEKCKETIVVIGEMRVQDQTIYSDEFDDVFQEFYEELTPKLFIPSLDIFNLQDEIPENIKIQIREAFYLFFVDNSACANKIRIVVELIMDAFKIKKSTIGTDRKRKKIQLHHRIEKFKIKYPIEGEFLMAIKWIGNIGSHSSELLTKDDTLDGFEMLEHVIYKLYQIESKKLNQLKENINKRKGTVKKRK